MFRVPKVLDKLFDNNQRDVKTIIRTMVQPVNALEEEMKGVEDLAGAFMQLRRRVQEGGETLDDVMVPAFALIREAGRRSVGKRHYDVQLIGGTALHQGRIAEMRTGEGKTLVATLALALNALEGKGCHLVTVNDYLAKVGMEEMSLLYRTLGLTVGLVTRDMQPHQRQAAYQADITYITNSELGFDYLRDNMAQSKDSLVLRADHPLQGRVVAHAPRSHALHDLGPVPPWADLDPLLAASDLTTPPAVVLLLVADTELVVAKYGERGGRFALIEAGAIDGLSIGYRTISAERDGKGRRLLSEVELWEVSLVTFPMLPDARVGRKSDADLDLAAAFRAGTEALRQG